MAYTSKFATPTAPATPTVPTKKEKIPAAPAKGGYVSKFAGQAPAAPVVPQIPAKATAPNVPVTSPIQSSVGALGEKFKTAPKLPIAPTAANPVFKTAPTLPAPVAALAGTMPPPVTVTGPGTFLPALGSKGSTTTLPAPSVVSKQIPQVFKLGEGMATKTDVLPGPRVSTLEAIKRGEDVNVTQNPTQVSVLPKIQEAVGIDPKQKTPQKVGEFSQFAIKAQDSFDFLADPQRNIASKILQKPVGSAISAGGAVIGATVGAGANIGEKMLKGQGPAEYAKPEARKQFWKDVIDTAKSTSDFGRQLGEEAVPMATLGVASELPGAVGVAGRVVDVLGMIPQVNQIFDDVQSGNVTVETGLNAGMALLFAYGGTKGAPEFVRTLRNKSEVNDIVSSAASRLGFEAKPDAFGRVTKIDQEAVKNRYDAAVGGMQKLDPKTLAQLATARQVLEDYGSIKTSLFKDKYQKPLIQMADLIEQTLKEPIKPARAEAVAPDATPTPSEPVAPVVEPLKTSQATAPAKILSAEDYVDSKGSKLRSQERALPKLEKRLAPDDRTKLLDFTDYVAEGKYKKPSTRNFHLEADLTDILEKHGEPIPRTLPAVAEAAGRLLEADSRVELKLNPKDAALLAEARKHPSAQAFIESQGIEKGDFVRRGELAETYTLAKAGSEKFRLKDDLAKKGIDVTDAQEKAIMDLNAQIFGDTDVKVMGQILANQEALGKYESGIIEILKGQADASATFYHEAVHKYLDVFTDRSEYIDILKEGQKRYGIEDFGEIEERIAEDFIKYAKSRTGVTGKLRVFFDKILGRINDYIGNNPKIEQLYRDIIEGKAKKLVEADRAANAGEVSAKPPRVSEEAVKRPAVEPPPLKAAQPELLPEPGQGDMGFKPKEDAVASTKEKSRVYERLQEELPDILKDDVSYDPHNLKENAAKAVDLVASDRVKAYRIAMGAEDAPKGQTETAVNIALAEKALADGNNRLYSNLTVRRSLEQTRRGQEIVAEKGSVTDNSTARYVKELVKARLEKLGGGYTESLGSELLKDVGETVPSKFVKAKAAGAKSKVSRAMDKIDVEVEKVKAKISKSKMLDLNEAQAFLDSIKCR